MDFDEALAQAIDLLRREKRVSYRALRIRFGFDDDHVEALKDELIYAKKVAEDEDGRVLVWAGEPQAVPAPAPAQDVERAPLSYTPQHLTEKILKTRSSLEGERKLVTVLFADVANYTALSEKLDPEEVHQIMDGCFKILTDETHQHEGTINQFTGDGVMALFGAPVAHEDHAQRACHAALSIQKAMEEYTEKVKRDCGVEFKMRIGLNSGPVIVGSIGDDLRMDYTAVGDTTNLASRVQNLARPGAILVSSNTFRLARGYFTFESLGRVEVKGKKEPQDTYKLVGAGEVETRMEAAVAKGLTRFVGRHKEMDALTDAWEKARSGSGQVVGIVGEAGVGKTRILLELRRQLPEGEAKYLEGRCLHFGGSMPYLPLLDISRSYFDIQEGDRAFIRKKKVRETALALDENLEHVMAPFQDLLSLPVDDEDYQKLEPQQKRERTFEALRDLLIRESQEHPLVVAIEDLHWIDKISQEFLDYLIGWLAPTRVLLILLYRPEYTHSWGSKSYYTKIGLDQLSTGTSRELVRSILDGAEVVPEIQELILQRTGGNPLFVEELTHSLRENGAIQKHDHRYVLSQSPSEISVPGTIEGIISARLDRLEDNLKRTMQVASVIGRDFAFRILQTITGMREDLKSHLVNLQGLEFIYEKQLFPELEYIFKHAITQEVAYNSLLQKRRKEIHERIGEAIEQIYAERLEESYEMLAYHFDHGEVWEKAFRYLSRSGDKARLAYANQEAITHYTRAIEVSGRISPALPEEKLLPVYEGRGLVWLLQTRLDEAIADFRMMRDMSRASGNKTKESESLCQLAFAHWSKFSEDQVPFIEQCAQEAMQLSQQTGDQIIFAKALTSLGLVDQWRGNLSEADRKLEEAAQICRREEDRHSLVQNLLWLGAHAYWQGDIPRAIPLCRESLAVSREIHDGLSELFNLAFLCLEYESLGNYGQAFTVLCEGMAKAKERENKFILGRLTNTLGSFHRELGDLSRAVEYDQESVELGRMHRISNVEISALINLGFDHCALGQHERALSYLAPTLDRVQREAFGAHRWRWKTKLPIGLAQLSCLTGEYERALRYVEEGLKEAQATSSQKYLAKGWALRGKILAQLGDREAAGAELQRAHTLAEQLGSPTLSYPIAFELGRWFEAAGQEQKAAKLYGTAKSAIERMATAIEDEALRATFVKTAQVQAIYGAAGRK
jgi:class 3 adenylate cyclase/tetratricopeptide (TPR) repeat protein